MALQINFRTISPCNTREFFQIDPAFILNPPVHPNDEPSGFLTVRNGLEAYVEFVTDYATLSDKTMLGDGYRGPGIYLLDYYQKKPNEEVPFWVVVEENKLTSIETIKILQKIQALLLNEEHLANKYWSLN